VALTAVAARSTIAAAGRLFIDFKLGLQCASSTGTRGRLSEHKNLSTPPPHTLPPSAPSAPRSSRLRRSVPPALPVSHPDLGMLAETLGFIDWRRRRMAAVPETTGNSLSENAKFPCQKNPGNSRQL